MYKRQPPYRGRFSKNLNKKENLIKIKHQLQSNDETSIADFQNSLKKFGEISIDIPKDAILSNSPSGYNIFAFSRAKHKVIYTGGYLNFCMFNNSISLIRDFLKSSIAKELTIVYETDAITVQGFSSEHSHLKNSDKLSFSTYDLGFGYDVSCLLYTSPSPRD